MSLEQLIHEITMIPTSALRGADISQFEVDERFKWAETRQTAREEDWAYCLMGIFRVSMPVLYGEGKQNAVQRLRREIISTETSTEEIAKYSAYLADPRLTDQRHNLGHAADPPSAALRRGESLAQLRRALNWTMRVCRSVDSKPHGNPFYITVKYPTSTTAVVEFQALVDTGSERNWIQRGILAQASKEARPFEDGDEMAARTFGGAGGASFKALGRFKLTWYMDDPKRTMITEFLVCEDGQFHVDAILGTAFILSDVHLNPEPVLPIYHMMEKGMA
jgi:hypothetical protein